MSFSSLFHIHARTLGPVFLGLLESEVELEINSLFVVNF
jgi:hypothetical protein